jgi:hypothetical protein
VQKSGFKQTRKNGISKASAASLSESESPINQVLKISALNSKVAFSSNFVRGLRQEQLSSLI